MTTASAADETSIRAACFAKDFDAATAAGLRTYGAEVFGLLIAVHKDRASADDAFSLFADRFWRTLRSFQWKCSLRTWIYRLVRAASADVSRQVQKDKRRPGPISRNATVEQIKQQVRTETISVLPTGKRNELERLRNELEEEERLLLVLRVDREMPWREVTRVMSDLPDDAPDDLLAQEAARLRKRFQLIKDRLRRLGQERGLI